MEEKHQIKESQLLKQKSSVDRASQLVEMTRTLSSQHDMQQLFQNVMQNAQRLLEADRATLFLVDKVVTPCGVVVAIGSAPIRIPTGTGIVGRCVDLVTLLIYQMHTKVRTSIDVDRKSGSRTVCARCARH